MSDIPRSSPRAVRDADNAVPVWKVIVGGVIYASLSVGPFLLAPSPELLIPAIVLAVLASPFVGPYVIWRFVRWLNQRDDPRFAKLPSEAP